MNIKQKYAPIKIEAIEDRKPQSSKGDGSRSVRKKAYHRALKRGESWAKMQNLLNSMNRFHSALAIETLIYLYSHDDNPVKIIGLRELVDKEPK